MSRRDWTFEVPAERLLTATRKKRDYHTNNNLFASHKQFSVNLIDLKFDKKGFNALALSGQDILIPHDGRVVLSFDDEGKAYWVMVGAALILTLGVIATGGCQSNGNGCS